jgi:hypothetical protein
MTLILADKIVVNEDIKYLKMGVFMDSKMNGVELI